MGRGNRALGRRGTVGRRGRGLTQGRRSAGHSATRGKNPQRACLSRPESAMVGTQGSGLIIHSLTVNARPSIFAGCVPCEAWRDIHAPCSSRGLVGRACRARRKEERKKRGRRTPRRHSMLDRPCPYAWAGRDIHPRYSPSRRDLGWRPQHLASHVLTLYGRRLHHWHITYSFRSSSSLSDEDPSHRFASAGHPPRAPCRPPPALSQPSHFSRPSPLGKAARLFTMVADVRSS